MITDYVVLCVEQKFLHTTNLSHQVQDTTLSRHHLKKVISSHVDRFHLQGSSLSILGAPCRWYALSERNDCDLSIKVDVTVGRILWDANNGEKHDLRYVLFAVDFGSRKLFVFVFPSPASHLERVLRPEPLFIQFDL